MVGLWCGCRVRWCLVCVCVDGEWLFFCEERSESG